MSWFRRIAFHSVVESLKQMLNFNHPLSKASISEPQWKVSADWYKTCLLLYLMRIILSDICLGLSLYCKCFWVHSFCYCAIQVLVYDNFGQSIISPLLTVKELRDLGVTLHLWVLNILFCYCRLIFCDFSAAVEDGTWSNQCFVIA